MHKCDGCIFDDTCVDCNNFDCEELELLLKEHNKQMRSDAIDEFVKEMGKYWGGLSAMKELEAVAKRLKD